MKLTLFSKSRLFDYDELKRCHDLPKQTYAISDPDHFGQVISVPFLVVLATI